MKAMVCWVRAPLTPGETIWYIIGCTPLIFFLWFVLPIILGTPIVWEYLAMPLGVHNIAVLLSRALSEEILFRAVPVIVILALFPKSEVLALSVSLPVAYLFGMWHEWVYTTNICLGLGGLVLSVVYLKCGGSRKQPLNGVLVCGGIHATCNLLVAGLAHAYIKI